MLQFTEPGFIHHDADTPCYVLHLHRARKSNRLAAPLPLVLIGTLGLRSTFREEL